jgi:NADPH2:quinone reductase
MVVDVSSLMGGNRSLSGVFLGAEIMTDRAHDMIQTLINDYARGDLSVVIDKVFPLSDAAGAHAYIESRQAVGRVVMVP